jgi:hypothetical protein
MIPGKGEIFSSPEGPDWWSLFYLEWSEWGVRLTTHFHLVLRLRISGAISPHFYTPSWREQVKNYLTYLTTQYQTSSKFVAEISDKKHTEKHKRAPNYAYISHKEYIKTMSYGLTLIYFKSYLANSSKPHFNSILSTKNISLFRLEHGEYTMASTSSK